MEYHCANDFDDEFQSGTKVFDTNVTDLLSLVAHTSEDLEAHSELSRRTH